MVETSCGAECLVFSEVLDAQLWEVVRDGVDEGLEDGLFIVADDEDFLDLWNGGDSAEAVLDNGVAGDREQRLWQRLVGCERGRDGPCNWSYSVPWASPWTEA